MSTLGGGERRTLLLASHLAQNGNKVILFIDRPIEPGRVEDIFGIALAGIKIVPLGRDAVEPDVLETEAVDVFINNSFESDVRCPARCGIYMCMFPLSGKSNLSTYDVVTANSKFTASWIATRWKRDARVVYSACHDMGPPDASKKNVIICVGRFFEKQENNHHKKQDAMIEAFTEICHTLGQDWSLHLIGNVGSNRADHEYLDQLRAASRGYPIRISEGLSFEALRDAYRSASIYWHATGLGTDDRERPEQQEHFGMTIVEAMSAGCVPIVFDSGGPREIVEHGSNGFRYQSKRELAALTTELVASPARRRLMAKRARRDSRKFTASAYLRRMDAIISEIDRSTSDKS